MTTSKPLPTEIGNIQSQIKTMIFVIDDMADKIAKAEETRKDYLVSLINSPTRKDISFSEYQQFRARDAPDLHIDMFTNRMIWEQIDIKLWRLIFSESLAIEVRDWYYHLKPEQIQTWHRTVYEFMMQFGENTIDYCFKYGPQVKKEREEYTPVVDQEEPRTIFPDEIPQEWINRANKQSKSLRRYPPTFKRKRSPRVLMKVDYQESSDDEEDEEAVGVSVLHSLRWTL